MLRPGTHVGPYEVLSLLGSGGMGEVYKARDKRLGRDVAIKVLPAESAADRDRLRRFEQEAHAVAALSHPSILALYDVGTHERAPYIVTELLEGESLRERLSGSPLPPRKAIELAIQIAQGLAAAHEKGIIHRDLKPANVFVTRDGQAKILDFGIAKLAPPGSPDELAKATTVADATRAGVLLGTVAYMSPEQVRGLPVDHRSDIFSFGAVLYEMLSGKRAFLQATAADTIAAIVSRDPPALTGPGGEAMPALQGTLNRCLEKRPGERFQSASDLAFALRSLVTDPEAEPRVAAGRARRSNVVLWLAGGLALLALAVAYTPLFFHRKASPQQRAEADPRRVLVLPFENRTNDPRMNTIGAMSADWIIQGLTQTGLMQAIPVTTALAYARDPEWKPTAGAGAGRWSTLASELGAGTVVSGAYYLSGGTLEIQAEVFDMGAKTLLGTIEPAEAPLENPLQGVHVLRQRLMVLIALHVNPHSAPVAAAISPPPSFQAYQAYIAGQERFFAGDFLAAIPLLEHAAAASPSFPHPLLLAAFGHTNLREFAEAQAIAGRLARSRGSLTPLESVMLEELEGMFKGDTAAQLVASRKAAELAPMGAATFEYGRCALRANRPQEAVETLRRLKPDSPTVREWRPYWWVLSQAQHVLGDYLGQLDTARRGRQLHPSSLELAQVQGNALIGLAQLEELERLREESLAVHGDARATAGTVMVGWASELRCHGHEEESRILVNRAVEWLNRRPDRESGTAGHRAALGQALFFAERYDDAKAVFARLAMEQTDSITYRTMLGVLAARNGDRQQAEAASRWLLEFDRPYIFGAHTRGRAAIAAWLGEKEQAISLLREALAQGQTCYEMHADWLLAPLWGYPPFVELLKPKG